MTIKEKFSKLGFGFYEDVANYVLTGEKFWYWPGSIDKHHNYVGGLADHTYEVINKALQLDVDVNDRDIIVLAGLFHDYGKIYDYEYTGEFVLDDDFMGADAINYFKKSKHNNTIRHVVESVFHFNEAIRGRQMPDRDEIVHCMLAHHGRLEWGSPVTPQTDAAWALHLADMYSANREGTKV